MIGPESPEAHPLAPGGRANAVAPDEDAARDLRAATPDRDEGLLGAVLGAVPAAMALLDGRELRVCWTNPAYVELLEEPWRSGGIVGRRGVEDAPGAEVAESLRRAAAAGVPWESTGRGLAGVDPGRAPSRWTVRPVPRPDGPPDLLLIGPGLFDRGDSNRSAEERQALLARTQARADLLTSITRELGAGTRVSDVLQTALRRAARLLGGTDAAVFELGPDARSIRGHAELRAEGRAGISFDLDYYPGIARALADLAPVWFDRGSAQVHEQRWLESHGYAATLALPLRLEERAIGVLLVNYADALPPPSEDELSLAQGLADHAALAFARARAFEAERAARERLALSQALTEALSTARSVAQVTRVVLDRGLAACGAAAGVVALHERGELQVVEAFGFPPDQIEAGRRFPIDAPEPLAEAVRTRRALWLASRPAEPPERAGLPAAPGARPHAAWAVLPLLADDGCLGAVGLAFAEPQRFDLDARSFLSWLALKSAQAMDRARLQEAETRARQDAERIGRLQERLMAIVGHDLRTPLSSIALGTSVMFQRGGLEPAQASTLSRIAASAQRMTSIIRDLLDFSRARQGQLIALEPRAADVDEICRRVLLEFEERVEGPRLRLAVSGDAGAEVDPERLGQVVSNLVGNALHHGAGSPVLVAVVGGPDELAIEVHNRGPPIPPGVLPEIFEPFRRGAEEGAEAPNARDGVGLGLFIVREIVRAHGGQVAVRSTAEDGTCFTVRLPRRRPAAPGAR